MARARAGNERGDIELVPEVFKEVDEAPAPAAEILFVGAGIDEEVVVDG